MELNIDEYREVIGRAQEQGALTQKVEMLETLLNEERTRRLQAEARVRELEGERQLRDMAGASLMGYLKGLLARSPAWLVLDIPKLKKFIETMKSYGNLEQAIVVTQACQSSLPDQAPDELRSRTEGLLVLQPKAVPAPVNNIDQLIVDNQGEVRHD